MKLLSIDLLKEYGFIENITKSSFSIKIMTKNKVDIFINYDNTFHYSNMGVNYPLKDITSLKKVYKVARNEELKPIK